MAHGRWLMGFSAGLLQLDEDAVRGGGMNEGDERAFRARARLLVDEARAAGFEVRDRGVDVVDAQRDVMQAWPALLDVSRDRRCGRRRLEQLELRFADRDEVRAHVLRDDVFGRLDLQAERI